MRKERFFKDERMPFAELRYSSSDLAFKPHMHRTLSIGAIEEGQAIYQIKGREAVLAPGSLVVVNPDLLHACNPDGEKARTYSMLHLSTDWCFQVQQSLWEVSSFVKMEKNRIDDGPLYEQYREAVSRLMDTKAHLQEKEQMLFDLACSVFSKACLSPGKENQRRENIKDLKMILAQDLQKDFTLNSLAGNLGVNPYTLLRSFKAAVGITPHAYRMNCRIEKARELLRRGWDIAETALECGFFDQSHFHRHFKAMTTVTPQEYRVNFVQ
ncbi:AraC-type DNA-binding protein [Desulfatibacillum alkenivorans DSM 16219]|jgi:AraC-like DNA-binding protein|uniref:AraC-type DNA-binding protein n=1 Tax=Desulfatibacillum alkenivorans DSM 16219 TaxID=1121393 RepID=A0A1M6KTT1_9BACT|nr:AraC family transcriptional regulator [Desulfatibacillum alkenivorans]SHJ62326.1 AraC-type DNA-binding protein [Desulfatibacillum alkenivorans DSM 16219]